MLTKRAIDWSEIGKTLMTPEVLGAIIGGTGAPLITYLARRKKEMPTWRRVAELLGAGVLGAGAGAGIGYGGKQLLEAFRTGESTITDSQTSKSALTRQFAEQYVRAVDKLASTAASILTTPNGFPLPVTSDKFAAQLDEFKKLTRDLADMAARTTGPEGNDVIRYLEDQLNQRFRNLPGAAGASLPLREHIDRIEIDIAGAAQLLNKMREYEQRINRSQ